MKKTALLGMATLLIAGLVAVGAFSMPFGNPGKRGWFGGNNAAKEAKANMGKPQEGCPFVGNDTLPLRDFGRMDIFRENNAMKKAIEDGDYEAYMTALEESWKAFKAEITEERFKEIVEHHNMMSEKMAAIHEPREKIQDALKNGNYTAWKEAIGDSPHEAKLAEVISEENFDTFVEMHNAMQSGDFEKANQLAEEIGFKGQAKVFGKNSTPRIGWLGHRFASE